MKSIKKEAKLNSLIHEEIRKNGFVHYKSSPLESFKSSGVYRIVNKIQPKLQDFKRLFKSMIEKPRLWASFVDWKEAAGALSVWLINAFIEGVVANWWTHKNFGLEFGWGMIIAHGFLINQGLDLYRRLKKDGGHKTIPIGKKSTE